MTRQRLNLRTPVLGHLVAGLTIALALVLVWYGLMVVLLAVKVSAHTVNSLSGYRTLYHDVVDLQASDFTTLRRLIAGFAGLIAFLTFTFLAFKAWPRPYLARGDVTVDAARHGTTTVQARAIERVGEIAACANVDVSSARCRLGDEQLTVGIDARRASSVAATLRDVHERVHAALVRHELPGLAVNVTLTAYDRQTRRELS